MLVVLGWCCFVVLVDVGGCRILLVCFLFRVVFRCLDVGSCF